MVRSAVWAAPKTVGGPCQTGGMAIVITLPTQDLLDALADRVPDSVQLALWDWQQPSGQEHIDLAVMPYMAPASILAAVAGENITTVQAQSLGHDNFTSFLPDGVHVSNAVGVHEDSTAELALALVLAAQRDLPVHVRAQREGGWNQLASPGLVGRTVLVVGVGGVGEAIRARLEPFGCTILRSASRARSDEHGPIGGPGDLPELVAQADVVVLVTPLTDATRGLFDQQMINQMRPGALLVNVGRGALVDTGALVASVREGRIRAVLDVVDPEPLPDDHPLRTLDGCLLLPHVGGRTTTMDERVVDLVASQAQLLADGREPAHRVI